MLWFMNYIRQYNININLAILDFDSIADVRSFFSFGDA